MLTPLPAAAGLVEHDRQMEALIEDLAVLARESTDAARILHPHQQKALQYLDGLSLEHHRLPLADPAQAGHDEVVRADVLRVASVVRHFVGTAVLRAVGLPRPQQIVRELAAAAPSVKPGELVVAHGDPTLGNHMKDTAGRTQLNDYDLAYVAPAPHAAAHTWAALALRAEYEPTPEWWRQFRGQVPGAADAARAGLPGFYRACEVARSMYVDVARTVIGELPVEAAWISLRRGQGANVIPFDRFRAVVESTRERFADQRPQYLLFGAVMGQPKALAGPSRNAETFEKAFPLERRILGMGAVADAVSPSRRLPGFRRPSRSNTTATWPCSATRSRSTRGLCR